MKAKKHTLRFHLSLLMTVAMGLLAACADNDVYPAPKLVVEGWIDEGEFPVVILTKTAIVTREENSIDSLTNNIVRWARVTISDGQTTETLIGRQDTCYFPPFVYTSFNMRGEAGKTYHLTVDYRGQHAEATTTIPPAIDVDSIKVLPVPNTTDRFQLQAWMHNDTPNRQYLHLFTHQGLQRRQWLSAIETVSLKLEPDERHTFTIYRGFNVVNSNVHIPDFGIGEEVSVKVATMDSVSYRFWSDLDDMVVGSRTPFVIAHRNARSNVDGALGYWCGYGCRFYQFTIGK